MEEWCRGRSWAWRAPILAYCYFIGNAHLLDSHAQDLFGGITLAVHEGGHLLFSYFGPFMGIAGGSIMQVAVPILAGTALVRQNDGFGLSVAMTWLASSLFGLALYIGDARAMTLSLVGFSNDPIHDWNYLLSRLNLLNADAALSNMTTAAAFFVWLLAMILGGWLLWRMAREVRIEK
jgi:hypothetical protein